MHASADVNITAKSRKPVPTGVAALAPPGTCLRVAPRSGLAMQSIDVAAGVIDPDYRGEIKIVLVNHGPRDFKVEQGARVAQLILERIVTNVDVVQVEQLPTTSRGSSGFGSTDLTYLSMGPNLDEDEPISVPGATHDGAETADGVGSGSAVADSQVPPQ